MTEATLEAELVLDTPDEKLRAVGLSFAKIASIKDLARKTLDGVVPPYEILHTLGDDEIVERLTQVRGIGRWTVEMLLMFRLGRPDILPIDDFGVRNGFRLAYGLRGMPTPRALAEYGARWAPFRSVAAWYLWRAVDLHKAGKLPAPTVKTSIATVKKKKKKQAAKKRAAAPGKRVVATRARRRK
jgi:3-methyladenine DNA glycosylase/8-oxoguanine DNA glycosylase